MDAGMRPDVDLGFGWTFLQIAAKYAPEPPFETLYSRCSNIDVNRAIENRKTFLHITAR